MFLGFFPLLLHIGGCELLKLSYLVQNICCEIYIQQNDLEALQKCGRNKLSASKRKKMSNIFFFQYLMKQGYLLNVACM